MRHKTYSHSVDPETVDLEQTLEELSELESSMAREEQHMEEEATRLRSLLGREKEQEFDTFWILKNILIYINILILIL